MRAPCRDCDFFINGDPQIGCVWDDLWETAEYRAAAKKWQYGGVFLHWANRYKVCRAGPLDCLRPARSMNLLPRPSCS